MMNKATLTGEVVAPWSPQYDQARRDYNTRFKPFHPDYVVYCQTENDVARAVGWARAERVPFRIRSGGHSYEAYSLINDGLVIDVSQLNSVAYDPNTATARMGAGAKLLDSYQALWDLGRVTIPGGSCPTVAISGLTLGGGFGLVSRRFGLTCDSLHSLTLIDARGRRVLASARSHPGLLWACRGGGGNNFGVVTEMVFETHPVGDVSIFFLRWPWSRLRDALVTFQLWAEPETLDDRLVAILTLPSAEVGHVSITGQFLGPLSALPALLKPLMAIPDRQKEDLREMSYIDAVKHFAGVAGAPAQWQAQGLVEHEMFKNSSAYAYQLFEADAIAVIRDALSHTPGPACLVQLDTYGGAIARIPPSATAFFHRRARSSLQYQAYWTDESQAPSHIKWVEQFRRAMGPFTVGAYVNYCDGQIKDWPRAYYGANLERLVALKKKWDPGNLFAFPQGLSQLAVRC